LRIVVDTNLWIRILLGGRAALRILEAWQADRFAVVVSQPLLDELTASSQRSRVRIPSLPHEATLQYRLDGLMQTPYSESYPGCRHADP
jgi:predicted nucleic acid-binding protein